MKKLLLIALTAILLYGCASSNYNSYDVRDLRVGMTKFEVERLIGPAERVLSIQWTSFGYVELLQYRNQYNQLFALEYREGILIGAEYIYQGYWYPMYTTRPGHGRPVFPPSYRPNRPAPAPPANAPSRPQNNNNMQPANPRQPTNNQNNSSSGQSTSRPSNSGSSRQPNNQQNTQRDNQQNTGTGSSRQSNNTNTTNSSGSSRQSTSSEGNTGGSSSSRQATQQNNESGSSRR